MASTVVKVFSDHNVTWNSNTSNSAITVQEETRTLTVLGETRTGKIVPWVVKSLKNRPPSLTDSKEDSERGRDSTQILTPEKPNHSLQIHNPTNKTTIIAYKLLSGIITDYCIVPENSSWMTPLSLDVMAVFSWCKRVTDAFSSRKSSWANRWSLLVNVLRVWESSSGSNSSSGSAVQQI